jgi:hypothetical protein
MAPGRAWRSAHRQAASELHRPGAAPYFLSPLHLLPLDLVFSLSSSIFLSKLVKRISSVHQNAIFSTTHSRFVFQSRSSAEDTSKFAEPLLASSDLPILATQYNLQDNQIRKVGFGAAEPNWECLQISHHKFPSDRQHICF